MNQLLPQVLEAGMQLGNAIAPFVDATDALNPSAMCSDCCGCNGNDCSPPDYQPFPSN